MDLYRFFDREDRLLYVGVSLSAAHRASQHRADKAWWPDVARMDVEHHNADRQSIEALERAAIIAERPLYNVIHNTTTSGAQSPTVSVPVAAGDVVALCLSDGTCPVGYVLHVYLPDEAYVGVDLHLCLYSWLTGRFDVGEHVVRWSLVRRLTKAERDARGHFIMDPLGDLQTAWRDGWGQADHEPEPVEIAALRQLTARRRVLDLSTSATVEELLSTEALCRDDRRLRVVH